MKNPFRPKLSSLPREFTQEAQLFALVFRQAREDYAWLHGALYRAMRPLDKVGLWLAPLLCVAQLSWLWSQIQTTGWTLTTLEHNWLAPLLVGLLGYGLWQTWRAGRRFLRLIERFPLRTLVVYPSGCVVFASDELGQYITPPTLFFSCLWKDILFHSNTNERAILIAKGARGVLISNRIVGCSCPVAQASRTLDELLARPAQQFAPIAEPR